MGGTLTQSPPDFRHQWQQFCGTPLGNSFLAIEQKRLEGVSRRCISPHLLEISVLGRSLVANSRDSLPYITLLNDTLPTMPPKEEHRSVDVSRIVVGSPEEMPLSEHRFSVVLLHHTLEFSHDPDAVLKEVDRVLMPGGTLLVLGFNPISLWGLCAQLPFCPPLLPPRYHFSVTPRLSHALMQLGLHIESCHYFFSYPAWVLRSLRKSITTKETDTEDVMPLLGALYLLIAYKREIPLTLNPLRLGFSSLLPTGLIDPSPAD